MYEVVGVRFKKAGKIYYFDPGEFNIQKGDYVIVETVRGIEYGQVVIGPKKVGENDVVLPLKKVLRIADDKDRVIVEENRKAAKEAFQICLEKIAAHQLEMKLIDVEYTFDRNKVIFYFTADGRVDFRELVKDLA
ncbi:MAG: stage 0 sporulation protein, partial [Bacillales bacterium]